VLTIDNIYKVREFIIAKSVGLKVVFASLWKRAGAMLIDFLAIILLFYFIIFTNFFDNRVLFTGYLYLAYLSPLIYLVALESIYGQTAGKMLLKIKVIQKSGKKASFGKCFLRNLLRLVDMLPAFYLIGILLIVFTDKKQRLGDLATGTVVVDYKK